MRQVFTLVFVLLCLPACSTVTVTDHTDFTPTLVPEHFFDGQLTAHGVVKRRSGEISRTFDAAIAACWKQGTGYLVEDFIFDDGEEQRRIWALAPNGNGSFTATAGDVVGPGTLTVAGNSLFLDYVLRVPLGESDIDVSVDDRMYLVTPSVLFNESVLTKFGVKVGSIGLVILRNPEADHDAARRYCTGQT